MSEGATDTGRTGRKPRGGSTEAAPSENQPEDEAAVEEDANEIGTTEGVYFTKVTNKDVWHGFNPEHDPIAKIWQGPDEMWKAKIEGVELPGTFKSAPMAKSFVAGYVYAQSVYESAE